MNSSTRGTNYAPNKTPPVTDKYRKGWDKIFGKEQPVAYTLDGKAVRSKGFVLGTPDPKTGDVNVKEIMEISDE